MNSRYLDLLVLGAEPKYADLLLLKRNNIDYVVSLLEEKRDKELATKCKELNIQHINYPIPNTSHKYWNSNEIKNIVENVDQLLKSGKSIYLHCYAGIHRTGSITIGLLSKNGYNKQEAKEILIKLRPVAARNMGEDRFNWAYNLYNKKSNHSLVGSGF